MVAILNNFKTFLFVSPKVALNPRSFFPESKNMSFRFIYLQYSILANHVEHIFDPICNSSLYLIVCSFKTVLNIYDEEKIRQLSYNLNIGKKGDSNGYVRLCSFPFLYLDFIITYVYTYIRERGGGRERERDNYAGSCLIFLNSEYEFLAY